MDGRESLQRHFAMTRTYARLYEEYIARGPNLILDPDDKEFREYETLDHYFSVGADALRITVGALVDNLRDPPASILDFPSGSGRVTRHLRAFFPNAKITVCDLYEYHVHFCVSQFDAEGVLSRENFDELNFNRQFDLIFCGSLLTHLPAELFGSAIRLISRSLSNTGLGIITLHGRHSEYRQNVPNWKYMDDRLFDIAKSTIPDSGFGYVDYEHDTGSLLARPPRYGTSFSRPHWTLKLMEDDYANRILGYIERGWDEHQDVLILGKPALNE